ncbi:MAG: transposase [bacterium]|nr:transposase [bacterium]
MGKNIKIIQKTKDSKCSKRVRLKSFEYKGFYQYYITICAFQKNRYFTDSNIVNNLLKILKNTACQCQFSVLVYCFMPDHLHLLIEGKDESSDMLAFIKLFKQYSGYQFKKDTGKKLWQENYYEHVVRKDEDMKGIINYILENPVRKGLIEDYIKYPYSGSFMFDLKEL